MHESVDSLTQWLDRVRRWTCLTGAGLSADSGIPTYRDHKGQWLGAQPIQHQEFIDNPAKRRRYWSRSAVGWPAVSAARPTPLHDALAAFEHQGYLRSLITQNVDRLHQAAGSHSVIDLHGRLDQVCCLACGASEHRDSVQRRLLVANPHLEAKAVLVKPDGDADIADELVSITEPPECLVCGGVMMPNVVFFGGSVPKRRVQQCLESLDTSDGLMVIGSSLQVYSGYRFVKYARELGLPIVIINRGITRGDELASAKFDQLGFDLVADLFTRACDGHVPTEPASNAMH